MANQNKQPSLQINMPEHSRMPISANIIRVTTTARGEVIVDFVFAHPKDTDSNGNQLGTLVSRVVIPIQVARDLQAILGSHLGKIKSE